MATYLEYQKIVKSIHVPVNLIGYALSLPVTNTTIRIPGLQFYIAMYTSN